MGFVDIVHVQLDQILEIRKSNYTRHSGAMIYRSDFSGFILTLRLDLAVFVSEKYEAKVLSAPSNMYSWVKKKTVTPESNIFNSMFISKANMIERHPECFLFLILFLLKSEITSHWDQTNSNIHPQPRLPSSGVPRQRSTRCLSSSFQAPVADPAHRSPATAVCPRLRSLLPPERKSCSHTPFSSGNSTVSDFGSWGCSSSRPYRANRHISEWC